MVLVALSLLRVTPQNQQRLRPTTLDVSIFAIADAMALAIK